MGLLRFGVFELDTESGDLSRRGRRLPLAEKPRRVLEALVENPGRLVSRQQLRERLWADGTHVDFDANLNAAVKSLRDALGDQAQNPRFVETLPRRGYRFIAPVEPIALETPVEAEIEPAPEGLAREPVAKPHRFALAALATVILLAGLWSGRNDAPSATEGRTTAGGSGLEAKAPEPARQVLLVLPFDNLDPTDERDFFADGLMDELIARVGALRPERLGVIARTSAMAYAGSTKTVGEIGLELGVDLVLEGSVRTDDPTDPKRLRISARLLGVGDQTPLFGRTWEEPVGNALDVQREIALEVARATALELLPGDRQALSRATTASSEAYELYLRGREAWYRFETASLEDSAEYFEAALRLDPGFAHAEAGLADAHNMLAIYRGPRAEHFELAEAAARRALELDSAVAEAHNALGYAQLYHRWDFRAAEASFDRALELAPNFAMAWHYVTGLYSALGRHDEAIEAGHRAEVLDPRSLSVRSDLGWYYLFADRAEGAIRECERTLEQDPDYGWAISCLVMAHASAGDGSASWQSAERRLRLDGVDEATVGALRASDPAESVRRFRERRRDQQRQELTAGTGWSFGTAGSHALLGEHEEALELLERAFVERDIWMVFVGVHPAFRGLHRDPRFEDLRRRIGLPAATP